MTASKLVVLVGIVVIGSGYLPMERSSSAALWSGCVKRAAFGAQSTTGNVAIYELSGTGVTAGQRRFLFFEGDRILIGSGYRPTPLTAAQWQRWEVFFDELRNAATQKLQVEITTGTAVGIYLQVLYVETRYDVACP